MSEDRATEILKNAILLEKRGHAFYAKVARQAEAEAVRRFFNMMAEEEAKHIQMLSEQFKSYHTHKRFKTGDYRDEGDFQTASEVLTQDLLRQISAAEYEAAAIAAALSMELKAIQVYSRRAGEAQDPDEKAFYEWLVRWENRHLDFLAKLDKELTESIWYDNGYWPF